MMPVGKYIAVLLLMGLVALPAWATVSYRVTGLSSTGDPIDLRSEMTISDNTLTLRLHNNSPYSNNPNDLLTSFYFDIVKNGSRPTMSYLSAVGDVYLTSKTGPDVLQTAGANLQALNSGDDTWQFKTFSVASAPNLGFGVGTAGNATLAPNGFNGSIVDGMDYGIYAGDVSTQSISDQRLVKAFAVFTFSGLTGFSEADIAPRSLFGLGTAPDSIHTYEPPEPPVPEPLTIVGVTLLAGCGAGVIRRRLDRKTA